MDTIHDRVEALKAFISLEAPLPVSAAAYLADRQAWLEGIRGMYASRKDDADLMCECTLAAVEAFREQPWPWVKDLLGQMSVELFKRSVLFMDARSHLHHSQRIASSPWARACGTSLNIGTTSRLIMTLAALNWELYEHARVLLGKGESRSTLVRSLLVHAGPGGVGSRVESLALAGMNRDEMLHDVYRGNLAYPTSRDRTEFASPREILMAITQDVGGEGPKLLATLTRFASIIAREEVIPSGPPLKVDLAVTQEVRDLLQHRLALQQANPSGLTMASP